MGKRREDDEFEDGDDGEDKGLSWRERDYLHDHPEEKDQVLGDKGGKKAKGAASGATLRSQLSRAFDSGEILGKIEERRTGRKSSPRDPDADEPPARAALIRKIRAATESKERHEALDELLAAGERLPDDAALLAALIDHPREELVCRILGQLEELLELQPLKHKASFVARLDSLRLTAKSSATLAVVERILDKV